MEYRGYSESELVTNRASLLLHGGSAADRRAWAEEAQRSFAEEGELREVTAPADLAAQLAVGRGVLYLPDATALGLEAQGQVIRCLQEREERPKIILGLPLAPDEAVTRGVLREDLRYRLQQAQVNLSGDEVREVIKARRQKAAEKEKAQAARTQQASGKKAAARKPARPVKARTSAPKKPAAKKPAKKNAGKK